MADNTETKLAVHEAVCAERYEGIQGRFDEGSKRMQKIEYLIYALMVLVLLGPGVAAELFKKIIGI